MADLARRSWAELRDEALKQAARGSNSQSRMEHWIADAFYHLALTFHHYNLDAGVDDQSLSTGAATLALPADLYIIMSATLKTSGGNFIKVLTPKRHSYVVGNAGSTSNEEPGVYARFGSNLILPAGSDDDYLVDIDYYQRPDPPDFDGSDTSPLAREWDQAIVYKAVSLALLGFHDVEGYATFDKALDAYLQPMAPVPLKMGSLKDTDHEATAGRPHGGQSQG